VLLFLNSVDIEDTFPSASDKLILSHGCDIAPYQFLNVHTPGVVILDSSTPYRTINQWTKECKKLGISIFNTRKQGAYIIK